MGESCDHDDGCIRLLCSVFEGAKHGRVDEGMRSVVKATAQAYSPCSAAPDAVPPRADTRPWRSDSARDKRTTNAGRGARRRQQGREWEGRKGASKCCLASAGTSGGRWEKKLVAPVTFQGLCNRCSTRNLDAQLPALLEAAHMMSSPDRVVDDVMHFIAISNSYVQLFIRLLRYLLVQELDGLEPAVRSFAACFMRKQPYAMPPAPDPTEDYDAFCSFVKEKQRRLNTTQALMDLGFDDLVSESVESAMEVVSDPRSAYEKDTAIKFAHIVIRGRGVGVETKRAVEERARKLIAVNRVAQHIDARTRFALEDICEAVGVAA